MKFCASVALTTLLSFSAYGANSISEDQLHKTLSEYCEKNKKDYLIVQSNTCKIAREKTGLSKLCAGDARNDSKANTYLDEIAMHFARAIGGEESQVRSSLCTKFVTEKQDQDKPACDAESKGQKTITRRWWNGQEWTPTTESVAKVEASAGGGDPHSLFNLGYWNESGAQCFKRDEAQAVKYYCQAYDKGFQMATLQLQNIGRNYGIPADKARELLGRKFGCTLTAEQKEYDAETEKLKQIAQQLLKKAEAGDIKAMTKVAAFYQNEDDGLPQDFKKAFMWAERAAKKGNAEAMGLLGSFYNRGVGTVKDDVAAFGWFLKAAKGGDADSMAFVGDCYRLGQGTETNLIEAVKWLSKAMDAGDTNAKESLIEMYQRGELQAVAFKSINQRLKNLEKATKK